MEHWFSQFRYGDPNDREFQKRLIDTFVNAVFVYDDKLILTYNYQHGTQKITLKEVEDFLGSDLVGLSPPARRKRHIACDELFHFIAKLIARSFCCSSLPNRTRCRWAPVWYAALRAVLVSEIRISLGFAGC